MTDSAQVWVESWIMPLGAVNVNRVIVSKRGSYTLRQASQNLQFQVQTVGSGQPCTATTTNNTLNNTGRWFHVAGWYDGLNVYVAIDGHVRATASCPNGSITPTPMGAFDIGGLLTGGNVTEDYSGRIDEVRVRPFAAQSYNATPFRRVTRIVGQCNDGRDGGFLDCREMTFVKTRDDTTVRFSWMDNRRTLGYSYGYWEMMWNGKTCTSPRRNIWWIHMYNNSSSNYSDNHMPGTFIGVCDANEDGPLRAGTYKIQPRVVHQGGNRSDWYVGWDNTTFMIEAEEIL
jgi:hypothetical protein